MTDDRTQAAGLRVSAGLPNRAMGAEFPKLPKELQDRLSDESLRTYELECQVFMRSLAVTLRNGS